MLAQAKARPVILFHNIGHAHAIATAAGDSGQPIEALTAPGAIRYLGAPLLKAIADEADLPLAIADCGNIAESAQAALRAGFRRLLYEKPHPAYEGLMGLAEAYNARLLPRAAFFAAHPQRLDLNREADPLQTCKEFLKNYRA
jgi:hypothetical protein